MPKWGGVRPHSGRPKGGVSDAKRRIIKALHDGGEEACAQVVTDLILEGEGAAILKLWRESSAHIPKKDRNEEKKDESQYVKALKDASS